VVVGIVVVVVGMVVVVVGGAVVVVGAAVVGGVVVDVDACGVDDTGVLSMPVWGRSPMSSLALE